MFSSIDISRIIVMVLPLFFAVSIHEAAHGLAAYKMGDETAARAGRITLNPVRHVDVFGSILLPLLLVFSGAPFIIGYAKPVPVNFARLTNWRKGTIWVSVAGILANLACLAVSGMLFRLLFSMGEGWTTGSSLTDVLMTDIILILGFSVFINAVLAVFNMLPIPPLDGSKVLLVFLPPAVRKRLASVERWGIILILILLVVKAEWLFRIIWFFILPLVLAALGNEGLRFVAGI